MFGEEDKVLVGGIITIAALLLGALFLFFQSKKKKTTLPLEEFQPFPLIRKKVLSHDTACFTFGLPSPDHILNLPTGQHISLRYFETDKDTGEKSQVMRSYTPVSDNTTLGEVSLVIKIYRPNEKFPNGGKLSQHLDSLNIGDMIDIKGPKGHMEYLGNDGNFWTKPIGKPKVTKESKKFIMIAGGTGITPMLQVLNYMFRTPGSCKSIRVSLLYANQTEDDILVREELESFVSDFPDRFKLHYTVDRPPETGEWNYSTGFISKDMIEKHCLFDGSSKDTEVFMCGPPPMIKFACLPNLKELGFTDKNWFVF